MKPTLIGGSRILWLANKDILSSLTSRRGEATLWAGLLSSLKVRLPAEHDPWQVRCVNSRKNPNPPVETAVRLLDTLVPRPDNFPQPRYYQPLHSLRRLIKLAGLWGEHGPHSEHGLIYELPGPPTESVARAWRESGAREVVSRAGEDGVFDSNQSQLDATSSRWSYWDVWAPWFTEGCDEVLENVWDLGAYSRTEDEIAEWQRRQTAGFALGSLVNWRHGADFNVNVLAAWLNCCTMPAFWLREPPSRWLTSDVVGLGRGIYADNAWERLPILGDALMDAGCEDQGLLQSLRLDWIPETGVASPDLFQTASTIRLQYHWLPEWLYKGEVDRRALTRPAGWKGRPSL